jgi:hypothetical protein
MGLFLFISIFIIMKLLIKKLLRENIQLADKLYFNQNYHHKLESLSLE